MLNLLQKRRSIRQYTDEPIAKAQLEQILQSALLAPSSKSVRPWEFIVLTDKAKIARLSKARQPEMLFAGGAQAAVVILADTAKSDVWIEDCAIAAVLMQLQAQALGLGSCWMQVRSRQSMIPGQSSAEYLRELLGIGEDRAVEAVILLGHPAEEKPAVGLDKLLYEKVYADEYGRKYFETVATRTQKA